MQALVNPKTGEVIKIVPDGAHLGKLSVKQFVLVDWDEKDAADGRIAEQLTASREPNPAVRYPFQKLDKDGQSVLDKDGRRECDQYVDLSGLPAKTRRAILDKSKRSPRVVARDVKRSAKRPAKLTDRAARVEDGR